MKALVLTIGLVVSVFSSFANAETGVEVLNCQISSGDFTEILVLKQTDDSYILKTLDNVGGQHYFELPQAEWIAKRISVPCKRDASKSCGHVYSEAEGQEEGWMYNLGQDRYRNIGNCN